jgi:hypothetical protein
MAPSIVTIGGVAQEASTIAGPYKDFDRGYLNREKELSGTRKHSPASYPHYLPTFELTGPAENGGVCVSFPFANFRQC